MRFVPVFVAVSLCIAAAQPSQPTPTVTGIPYSADQLQEHTTLENGKPVNSAYVIGHFFRDSQGRARTESALKSSPAWRIEIRDPVAGFAYVLDDQNKVVYRTSTQVTASRPNASQATTVSLGTQAIAGVLAEGIRTTFLSPSGLPTLSVETWYSAELNVTMLTKSSNGYSSKLVNLRREEPDPVLFRPPADYTVVDR
ncbi:MAG TPA: hypothetical protein VKB88_42220 [Bryobacteraceae bacterium]|nr:hypothetical protein [Bryobacteraceae bacterium]